MNQLELPTECWLLIIEQINYYQTMINLSRVSKLLYSLIPDERWIIKDPNVREWCIKGIDNNIHYIKGKDSNYLLGTFNLHGKLKSYNGDKKINSDRFINGNLEGKNKSWYTNGNRQWELVYKQDKAMGPVKRWYENGIISHYYYCNMGTKMGPFQRWYENGNLMFNCQYIEGELEGEYKSYHSNGNTKIHCYYSQGKVIGEYKEYDLEGRLTSNYKL